MTKTLLRIAMGLIICFTTAHTNDATASQPGTRDGECDYRVVMHKNSAPTGTHGWEGAFIMFVDDNNQTLATCTLPELLQKSEYCKNNKTA